MFNCGTCDFKTVNEEIYKMHLSDHKETPRTISNHQAPTTAVKSKSKLKKSIPRSDQESSAHSSASDSPSEPRSVGDVGPESPVMQLARGILGQDATNNSQFNGLNTPSSPPSVAVWSNVFC